MCFGSLESVETKFDVFIEILRFWNCFEFMCNNRFTQKYQFFTLSLIHSQIHLHSYSGGSVSPS